MLQLLSSLRGQGGSGPQGPETTGSRGHRGWSCSWSGTCYPKTSVVPACCPAVLSPEAVCGSAQADTAPPSLGLELLDGCPGTYQALSPGQTAFLWPAPLTSSPSKFPGPLIRPALVPLLHSTFPRGQPCFCKDGVVKLLDPVGSQILSTPTPSPLPPAHQAHQASYGHRTPSQSAVPHLGPEHLSLRLSWEGRGQKREPTDLQAVHGCWHWGRIWGVTARPS